MKMFSPIVIAVLIAVFADPATGQLSGRGRPAAAYHPNDILDPARLMSPAREDFDRTAQHRYVVVEGYINYVAGSVSDSRTTTTIKKEADGDYHFEMESKNAPRKPKVNPNGLVCEIDPPWLLNNWNLLSQISQKHPSTYRKVRVYGWLRYGTERGHSGSKDYHLADGTKFTGHWEIHPVERIQAIDGRGSFDIGPSARVTSWAIAERYKLTNANFAKQGPSNYAKLTGTVQRIKKSADRSGDIDVSLDIGSDTYVATIPQYYIASFDENAQTLALIHTPNFLAINYSLQPGNGRRTFYGLRTWHFGDSGPYPALQPVELIK